MSNSSAGIKITNADLRSKSGRLSIRLIGAVFGVPVAEMRKWIGNAKTDSESMQEPLQKLARIAAFRTALGGDVAFRQWLRTSHTLLGGKNPLELVMDGKALELAEFVEDALAGQPQ